jgi:hypothetical protein
MDVLQGALLARGLRTQFLLSDYMGQILTQEKPAGFSFLGGR